MRRNSQRGSAMLVTMIVVSALLAGAAVLVSMTLASSKSTDLERNGLASLYCAEAGMTLAQPVIIANYSQWAGSLCTTMPNCPEPPWLTAGFNHDLDGDGVPDVTVYIKDNDDEVPSNPAVDSDNKIFIVATCTKYPDTPKQVEELILYIPTPTCYQGQQGGCNGRGNNN
jgi:hypothetical protein